MRRFLKFTSTSQGISSSTVKQSLKGNAWYLQPEMRQCCVQYHHARGLQYFAEPGSPALDQEDARVCLECEQEQQFCTGALG
mmetsp:Transcript_160061/g.513524  ORF Transcript_160061/g.513524 Transcript_160061/m.513524 type:complete len:82 (+) Transcript_160061:451-696(+)